MTLRDLLTASEAHPELLDRDIVVEHIPQDITGEELLFTTVPNDPTVWIEPA